MIYISGITSIIFQKNTLCTYRKYDLLLPKVRHFFARRRSCFIFGIDDLLLHPARAPVCTGKKRQKSIFCYSYVTDSFLRSSSLQMFFKVGVLKMFVFFTTKKTCVGVSFFSKVAGLRAFNFIKKGIQHRCFPVKIEKFLRTVVFTEHLWWLLLSSTKTYLHFSFKRAFQKL